jgi:hypothetical protein
MIADCAPEGPPGIQKGWQVKNVWADAPISTLPSSQVLQRVQRSHVKEQVQGLSPRLPRCLGSMHEKEVIFGCVCGWTVLIVVSPSCLHWRGNISIYVPISYIGRVKVAINQFMTLKAKTKSDVFHHQTPPFVLDKQ